MNNQKLKQYAYLMRLHKPIGIFLLLWPTLWALWLASAGKPNLFVLLIFIAGVILMRSAGCVINDIADRYIDGLVQRTRERPLVTGKISLTQATALFCILISLAFCLVLLLNPLTILLAIIGVVLTGIYPLLKRITHLPQVGLGIAFAWGIPMAFAAETGAIHSATWCLFLAAAIWPIIYDTQYAMVDREDDLVIGVKSTAILFGKADKKIIGILQALFLLLLIGVGILFQLSWPYYLSLIAVLLLFFYQQKLIKNNVREACYQAFVNNHWVGFAIFIGIVLNFML